MENISPARRPWQRRIVRAATVATFSGVHWETFVERHVKRQQCHTGHPIGAGLQQRPELVRVARAPFAIFRHEQWIHIR